MLRIQAWAGGSLSVGFPLLFRYDQTMRCLVTCGPTFEPLDQVRRLTNFSTGSLGTRLANYLTESGHEVLALKGYYSTTTEKLKTEHAQTFSTTEDLLGQMRAAGAAGYDAVFHAAAVSDFGFGAVYLKAPDGSMRPVQSGKYSTRGEPILVELTPTVKILPQLRGWFPKAFIAGWKYEVDGGAEDALEKGREQLEACHTDVCVVNGPAYGSGFNVMIRGGERFHCHDSAQLFGLLGDLASRKNHAHGPELREAFNPGDQSS